MNLEVTASVSHPQEELHCTAQAEPVSAKKDDVNWSWVYNVTSEMQANEFLSINPFYIDFPLSGINWKCLLNWEKNTI